MARTPWGDESALGQCGQGAPDGHRCRKPHGAGAGDEEDGEAVENAGDPSAVQRPRRGGDGRHQHDQRKEPGDEAVGFALDAARMAPGFVDGFEKLVEATGASRRGRADAQAAVLKAAAGKDRVPRALDHGIGLAGERGFGNEGGAFHDDTIHRHALSGPGEDLVAGGHLLHGDAFGIAPGVQPLAEIEGGAEFRDRIAQGVASPARKQGAKGVDGDKDGDDLVVNVALSGEGTVHRGRKGAGNAREEKLLEHDPSVSCRRPRLAEDGQPREQEDAERGEGEGAVDDGVGGAETERLTARLKIIACAARRPAMPRRSQVRASRASSSRSGALSQSVLWQQADMEWLRAER